jgi:multisubunit Na+/H+ antiporter MnhB subunit
MVKLAFDGLVVLLLLWLAWQTLACADLFKAILQFISFSLVMALAWVRLDALDIALAEAAIGAGITGALLLAALARLRASLDGNLSGDGASPDGREVLPVRGLILAGVALATAGLGYAVLSLPETAPGLSQQIEARLGDSGVGSRVTAVLLNFRGYDTLLEMVVLMLALVSVKTFSSTRHAGAAPQDVLQVLSRVVVLPLILVTAYFLWAGTDGHGGAFQAGSVLGAAGVLLLLSGWRLPSPHTGVPLRALIAAGPGLFVIVALVTLLLQGTLLTYPPAYAGSLILLLEIAATFSIGATLAMLFLGGLPGDEDRP